MTSLKSVWHRNGLLAESMINEEIRNQIREAVIETLEVLIKFAERTKTAFRRIKAKI